MTTQPEEVPAEPGEWRGHSLAILQEVEARKAELHAEWRRIQESVQARLDEVRARLDEAEDVKKTEVALMLGIADPSVLEFGVSKCPGSPTGRCVYDDDEDFNHDYCLVCGSPSERK